MREAMVPMIEVHVYQYLLFPPLRLHWRDCKELKRATEQRRVPWLRNKEAAEPSSFHVFQGIFIGFLTWLRLGKGRERNTFTPWAAFKRMWNLRCWKKLNWNPHGGCHSLRWLSPLLSKECFGPERDVKKEVQTHTYIHTNTCCFRFLLSVRAKCVRHTCGLSNHPK